MKTMSFFRFSLIAPVVFLLINTGCGDKPVPKPHGYVRISFPEKSYKMIDSIFPYRFEIPDYAGIIQDPESPGEPNWINIQVPANKAEIHISYYGVDNRQIPGRVNPTVESGKLKNLARLIEDSREFVYKHTVKADAINEQIFLNPAKKMFGTMYFIEGNAASPVQFYLTDSTTNFLQGCALYS